MESKQGKRRKEQAEEEEKRRQEQIEKEERKKKIDEEIEKTSKKKMAEDIKLGEKTFKICGKCHGFVQQRRMDSAWKIEEL